MKKQTKQVIKHYVEWGLLTAWGKLKRILWEWVPKLIADLKQKLADKRLSK